MASRIANTIAAINPGRPNNRYIKSVMERPRVSVNSHSKFWFAWKNASIELGIVGTDQRTEVWRTANPGNANDAMSAE